MGLAEADKESKPEVEPAEVEVLLEKELIPDIAEPIAASPREGKVTSVPWFILETDPIPDVAECKTAQPKEGTCTRGLHVNIRRHT